MEKKVKFHSGVFNVTLTVEEVKDLYEDLLFLQDAILVMTNPKVAEKSDLPYLYSQCREFLISYFKEKTNFCKDFIDAIFAEEPKKITEQ